MAFGGVATGIINAMEAATVAGIASIRGSISMPIATAPSTGRKVAADAVFDVISVENTTVMATINIINQTFTSKPVTASPIQTDKPV